MPAKVKEAPVVLDRRQEQKLREIVKYRRGGFGTDEQRITTEPTQGVTNGEVWALERKHDPAVAVLLDQLTDAVQRRNALVDPYERADERVRRAESEKSSITRQINELDERAAVTRTALEALRDRR